MSHLLNDVKIGKIQQLTLVADRQDSVDIRVSKKEKLLERLQSKRNNFTWNEAVKVMRLCGFRMINGVGSARMFVHEATRAKVRLHEPHPQNTLLPYMVEQLIEGLRSAGEIE